MADPDPYATIQGDTIPGAAAAPAQKKATVRIGVPQKSDAKQTIKINIPAGGGAPPPGGGAPPPGGSAPATVKAAVPSAAAAQTVKINLAGTGAGAATAPAPVAPAPAATAPEAPAPAAASGAALGGRQPLEQRAH